MHLELAGELKGLTWLEGARSGLSPAQIHGVYVQSRVHGGVMQR